MSAVSSISLPPSVIPTYSAPAQSTTAQALAALGDALQSGNVAGAQSALSTVQQGVANDAQNSNIPPFPSDAQADADYADLINNVQAGNLSSAQAALSKLQIDLQSSRASHHHAGAVPVPTTTIDTSDSASSEQTTSTSGNFVNVTV